MSPLSSSKIFDSSPEGGQVALPHSLEATASWFPDFPPQKRLKTSSTYDALHVFCMIISDLLEMVREHNEHKRGQRSKGILDEKEKKLSDGEK